MLNLRHCWRKLSTGTSVRRVLRSRFGEALLYGHVRAVILSVLVATQLKARCRGVGNHGAAAKTASACGNGDGRLLAVPFGLGALDGEELLLLLVVRKGGAGGEDRHGGGEGK